MPNLQQLALERVKASGLPVFPGASVPEQLAHGRAEARAALLKYVPSLKFDLAEARDVMSHVDAWVVRNQVDLSNSMASPETELPRWLELNMGNGERVQQWIIANFTQAAAGMGPWASGKVAAMVADPNSGITKAWADGDAQARLDAFAMIVKLEDDGDLRYIFQGPANGANGFGAVPALIVWAVVVTVVALAAVVATYFYIARRLEMNNAVMNDLCLEAQKQGDTATVQKCIEAARDIQMDSPWAGLTKEIGSVALILGGGYLALKFGLPILSKQLGKLFEGKKKATANPWEIIDNEEVEEKS